MRTALPKLIYPLVFMALAVSPALRPAGAAAPPELVVETFARGLNTPWAIAFAPDGRIFLTERGGLIRVIEGGQLRPQPWMALEVASGGESGLLGIAVDSHFIQNRYLYVAYTYRAGFFGMRNRLVRLRDDPRSRHGILDKVLIEDVPGANNHDGGRVKFGPDGKLYWTTGDAQMTKYAQDRSSLLGKILRLNTDGSIPPDNPFPNSFVFAYGLRNPQGLAWQPATNHLYATDHGPSGFQGCCRDEVNFIEAGKNYGWPTIRGDETRPGMEPPIIHSGSSETWAPAGAAFATRGPWANSLLFTGLRGQTLYRAVLDPGEPRKVIQLERHFARKFGRLRDIAEGPDGALYMLTSNRDGRGNPAPDDDRILRLTFK